MSETYLTQAEVNVLPAGTEVEVIWGGGNGPHRYKIERDKWGTVRVSNIYHDRLDSVGTAQPSTQVCVVQATPAGRQERLDEIRARWAALGYSPVIRLAGYDIDCAADVADLLAETARPWVGEPPTTWEQARDMVQAAVGFLLRDEATPGDLATDLIRAAPLIQAATAAEMWMEKRSGRRAEEQTSWPTTT